MASTLRAALVGLVLLGCGESEPTPASEAGAADDLTQDPRLDYLLAPCAKSEHYDVDTSDPLPILVETLQRGQRDPLRRAREELGARGAEGVRAVRRLVEANLNAQDGGAHLRNAIDVLTRSDDPGARDVLLSMFEYREQSVAVLAAEALKKHARPEDFEAVAALFDGAMPEFRVKLALLLQSIDAPRAERIYLDWFERGEAQELWDATAAALARTQDAGVAERCAALLSAREPRHRLGLAGAAAKFGDERALGFVRESLRSPNATLRKLAIATAGAAGLQRELEPVLSGDADPEVRLLAFSELSKPECVREHVAALRAAMGDASDAVASGALVALCKQGDAGAIERALSLLDDPSPGSVGAAMQALGEPIARDPALARRAFERLSARRASEATLPLDARAAVFGATGQIPLEEAARALHDLAHATPGAISSLPASRWLTMQAGNTGEPGQRYLLEQLALERDPRHRIDLLEGLALKGGDFARRALVELLDGDTLAPYEILFAADRLTRLGPVEVAAPLLKRVTLRVAQPDVRLALQCLLWSSYPGPR